MSGINGQTSTHLRSNTQCRAVTERQTIPSFIFKISLPDAYHAGHHMFG